MNGNRKRTAKVLSITGTPPAADVLRDEDYGEVAMLQALAWNANAAAKAAADRIAERLRCGARDEGEQYYYDTQLGMVRTKRAKAGNE